jgi:hypothetical protein
MIANGQQQLMATDFDDRIDIIPVSDPNIFSMSQRVMLAQEMLKMVQSNPEIHGPQGIYNAYKRMYEAMGIQQVDQLLPPPPQPQPTTPSLENSTMLQGKPAQAFETQDHDAHIAVHLSLYQSAVAQNAPPGQQQLLGIIQAHIYQHVDFKAKEMAMQDPQITQMQQQMQQMQQQAMQDPAMQQQLQQMQQQMAPILEDKVAQISSEILNDLAPQFKSQDDEDPLVELRREELGIKAEDVERKAKEAQQRIDIEQERLDRNMGMAEDRLETQVDIADMKNDTAQDRINLQREAQMAKTAENMAKDFFGRNQ